MIPFSCRLLPYFGTCVWGEGELCDSAKAQLGEVSCQRGGHAKVFAHEGWWRPVANCIRHRDDPFPLCHSTLRVLTQIYVTFCYLSLERILVLQLPFH